MKIDEDDDLEILGFGRMPFPVVSLNRYERGYLNVKASELVKKENADRVSFARNNDGAILIAFPNRMSEIPGHIVRYHSKRSNLISIFSVKTLMRKFDLSKGHYKIMLDETIFKRGIQWYLLELIEETRVAN